MRSSEVVACPEHPSASSAGVCPRCLERRLLDLLCSDCGENRASSSRIAFLIESERGFRRSGSSGRWRRIRSLFGRTDDGRQVFDEMRESRSRSLCSFRDDGSDRRRFPGAKVPDAAGWAMPDSDDPRNGEGSATCVDTKPRLSWSGRGVTPSANAGEESERGKKSGRKRYRVWKWMSWQK